MSEMKKIGAGGGAMNEMRTWAVNGVAVACLIGGVCACAPPQVVATGVGDCPQPSILVAESANASGGRITVDAKVFRRADCLPADIGNFWGSTDVPVSTFIGELRVSADGEEVWVPLSTYIDLGDPSAIQIQSVAPDGFTVEIRGSGDSAFIARIDIRNSNVVRRRLFNPAFEGEAGELSEYSYPPDW